MNKYDQILYDNIDEDVYVIKSFGKSLKSLHHFVPRSQSDLVLLNKSIDHPELLRDLHIGTYGDATLCLSILDIIHDNWDPFCE